METTVKKREWVKDAAILFLAVLLVLTFFSNTIMNRSLPEVATAAVTSGNIIAKVRGTGTVTATGKHQVKAKETRTIRSVMVKVGQQVNAGDVLFVLGEGDETLLEQAKEKLRSLQYEYERQALNVPTYDGSSYDRAVDTAYQGMIHAEQARDKAASNYYSALERESAGDIQALNKELQDVEEQLSSVVSKLSEAQSSYDSRHEKAWQQVQDAQIKFDIAYNEWVGNNNNSGNTSTTESSDDYSTYTEPEYIDYGGETLLEDSFTVQEEDILFVDELAESYSPHTSSTSVTMWQWDDGGPVDQAWAILENAKSQLSAIENDSYLTSLKEQHEALLARRETLTQRLNGLSTSITAPYKEALDEAEYELYLAQINYDSAISSRNYAYQNFDQSVAVSGVNLQEVASQIAVQQEKIKSLAGDEENVITATVSGTIDTIDCTAGDTVVKDALLCTMEVPDMGHTLSFSVTNDQAQRLRIGDTATISNYYWGNSVTATLTTIRTDPKNPQSNKILTFDLEGDVTSGAEMTISVGQKSANYDIIVPNSAIKSDTNGSFVLAVAVKSSPLGNRYTAKRVSVEVLASDDNNSAIVADLANGDYVITTSSAPVASGDMVRIADNQT